MLSNNFLTLSDLVALFNKNTVVNLYNSDGMSINLQISKIEPDFLKRQVLKYKVDNVIPNIHIKI